MFDRVMKCPAAKFTPPEPPKVQLSAYRIFTKEDYKRYVLGDKKASSIIGITKQFEAIWKKISRGYNFVIGVGKENNMMIYSVETFNKEILGGVNNE